MTGESRAQQDIGFLHAWKQDENAMLDDLRQHMEQMTERCRDEDYREALGALSAEELAVMDEVLLACCGQFMSFQEDELARRKAQEFRERSAWKQNPDISILSLLTSVLRTLRNGTVHNPRLQDTINQFSSLDWMGGLLTSNYLLHEAGEAFVEQLRTMRRVLVQAMTNVVVNSEKNVRKLWDRIVPTVVLTGLQVANANASNDVVLAERLCMLVHSCVAMAEASQRLEDLVHSRSLLSELFMSAPSSEESGYNDSGVPEIILWVTENILERNLLTEAWEALAVRSEDSDALHHTTKEQLVLLYSLEAILEDRAIRREWSQRDLVTICSDSLFSVEALVSPGLGETQRVWCHMNIKKCQLTLRIMAKYCELLEDIVPYTGSTSAFQDELRSKTHVLEFCVGELRIIHQHSVDVGKREEHCTLDIPTGYRSDLLHTIGCIVHKNRGAQNQVLHAEGVPMVLNNCRILASEPLLREWALLTIRNLCEGNEEIQNLIAAYKAEDVANPEEAKRMGLEAKVEDGKLRVEAQRPR
eukprot:gb/GECG01006487.1/.p1 GENE.gb/GECG01006487.1/~~gb/GECG01006487.1/.p1  ORF type:complete len:530 (+),score=64.25 gb/GECG01006487.1/:1-1590(+)